jgi:23S rRNA pseudouridine2605 synthase
MSKHYPSGRVALERALSKLRVASRSEAQRAIRAGAVAVNGRIVRDPLASVHPERDRIVFGADAATRPAWRTIAFHKPRGTVTTRRDPRGRHTVFDVLGDDAEGLVAVGRLDLATSGLLLLTTDTRLAERLTNPSNAVVRRYAVTARGFVSDEHCAAMEHGIDSSASRSLRSPAAESTSDDLRAASVRVRKRSRRETHLIVELTEGKNREIRRLFAAVGAEVTKLVRIAYGPIELGSLRPGEWRELTRDAFSRL